MDVREIEEFREWTGKGYTCAIDDTMVGAVIYIYIYMHIDIHVYTKGRSSE